MHFIHLTIIRFRNFYWSGALFAQIAMVQLVTSWLWLRQFDESSILNETGTYFPQNRQLNAIFVQYCCFRHIFDIENGGHKSNIKHIKPGEPQIQQTKYIQYDIT